MRQVTFLSVPFKPWSLSLGFHLGFFLVLVLVGRQRTLDITFIDLDLAPSSKNGAGSHPSLADEEWRKPQELKPLRVPAVPQPLVKPQEVSPSVPGPSSSIGGSGTGEFRSIAQVSQLPHFVNQVKAQYPEAAKRANIEGVVILQVDIDAIGGVKKVDLIQGLGYGCDEAALTAVQQSTFTPALAGGEPVPVRIRIPYRFKFEY